MLDEIIKKCSRENFIYYLCTQRELKFLKKYKDKKITQKDYEKNEWEIKELHKKCIISIDELEIYDEQKENVEKAVKRYEVDGPNNIIDLVTAMIGFVKSQGEIVTNVIKGIFIDLTNRDEEFIEAIFGYPLFHFYCGFYNKYISSLNSKEEFAFYRKYEWDIVLLDENRKKYGTAGTRQIDMRDYMDIFYYDFPIRKPSVKKMYDKISKCSNKESIFNIIDKSRLLNDNTLIEYFIKEDDTKKIIYEALKDIPCAAMNGFTPNEYEEEKKKDILYSKRLPRVCQVDAHLSKNACDEYYKLYFALLEYTNKKYNIEPKIKKIYKAEALDARLLLKIDDYLWSHKEIIDDFIKENVYKFNEEELDIIAGFKTAIKSDRFLVIGFQRDYTEILSEEGKIYMVKGVRANLDKLIKDELPVFIETALLMFKGKLIYNSFFTRTEMVFGSVLKRFAIEEREKCMKYYHL